MPFKSYKQRRFMFARHPEIAHRWAHEHFKRKVGSPMSGSVLLRVHQLDVWGNKKEGYEVNDVYPATGDVRIEPNMRDAQLVSLLQNEKYLTKGVKYYLEGEMGYSLYVTRSSDNKPVLELRPYNS